VVSTEVPKYFQDWKIETLLGNIFALKFGVIGSVAIMPSYPPVN